MGFEYQHNQFKNSSDAWKYPHHNTKLWIGYDCENQGSNTPIGFQMMLEVMSQMQTIPISVRDIVNTVIAGQALALFKTRGVASQNTLYHINKLSYCSNNVWCIDHHNDYNDYFVNQLLVQVLLECSLFKLDEVILNIVNTTT